MSTASVAAAKIYIAMQDMTGPYNELFMSDISEPYRAVIDLARSCGMHSIVDGSEEYARLVDFLEDLVCD